MSQPTVNYRVHDIESAGSIIHEDYWEDLGINEKKKIITSSHQSGIEKIVFVNSLCAILYAQ